MPRQPLPRRARPARARADPCPPGGQLGDSTAALERERAAIGRAVDLLHPGERAGREERNRRRAVERGREPKALSDPFHLSHRRALNDRPSAM